MPAVAQSPHRLKRHSQFDYPDSFNGVYVNVVTGQTCMSGGSVPGWDSESYFPLGSSGQKNTKET